MLGDPFQHERSRAIDRLLDALPARSAAELQPVLDPRVPDPEGVVLYLLTREERQAARRKLGGPGSRGEDDGGGALLRRLIPFPAFDEVCSLARSVRLRGRTDWLRFTRGRMPGTAAPDALLPAHPDVVYRGQGFRSWKELLWFERDPPAGAGERYWPFETALAFAQSLGLIGQSEWHAYSRGDLAEHVGIRPKAIPGIPSRVYDRFPGMRAWLGAPNDRPAVTGYPAYKKARRFVWRLGLKSRAEWRDWVRSGRSAQGLRRPGNIPALPETIWPDCWRGMATWLGHTEQSSPERRGHRAFPAARAFARSLGLEDVLEWRAYMRGKRPDLPPCPEDIPANPDTVYEACGFQGYGDWLGTKRIAPTEVAFRPFEEAREFARSLGLAGGHEWMEWVAGRLPGRPSRPPDIPVIPWRTYEDDGWAGWGDFLGTGNRARGDFREFAAARSFARSLGLSSEKEWRALCRGDLPGRRRPDDIPASPDQYYRDRGWTDWGDFLGTGNVHGSRLPRRPFEEARAYVRTLGLSSHTWRAFVRGDLPGKSLPPDIPCNPDIAYRQAGWLDWPDFLGRRRRPERWMPFSEARRLVQSLHLARVADYRAWLDGMRPDLPPPPDDLPLSPQYVYADDGFAGWRDFLGRPRKQWMPFSEARRLVGSLHLSRKVDYLAWLDGARPDLPPPPDDLPRAPNKVYARDGCRRWRDFLGPRRDGSA